jgi:hypothetical protein
MMLNVTFNNVSVTGIGISQLSVLLVEETGNPSNNYRSTANHCQTFITNIQKYIEVITSTVNLMCPSCPFEALT